MGSAIRNRCSKALKAKCTNPLRKAQEVRLREVVRGVIDRPGAGLKVGATLLATITIRRRQGRADSERPSDRRGWEHEDIEM